MAVAVFCLQQARQAIRLGKVSPQDLDPRFGIDEFDMAEYYVLKLDHVYKSCCQLNKGWPSAFSEDGPARQASDTFIRSWTGEGSEQLCETCANHESLAVAREQRAACASCKTGRQRCSFCPQSVCNKHAHDKFGRDLRNAYTHYERVMANSSDRLRGEPSYCRTVRGVDSPDWARRIVSDPEKAPETLWLLGKEYQLDIYEALRGLVRESSEVLEAKAGELREDA